MNFVCVNNAAVSALMLLQQAREQKNASSRDENASRRDGHDPSYLLFIGADLDIEDIDKILETRIVSLRA